MSRSVFLEPPEEYAEIPSRRDLHLGWSKLERGWVSSSRVHHRHTSIGIKPEKLVITSEHIHVSLCRQMELFRWTIVMLNK
jgi:hypothetical protein